MFCCTLFYVHSSIAIIFLGKRELVALLNLSSWCLVMVEWLFLVVPWGCLWFVIGYFLILLFLYRGVLTTVPTTEVALYRAVMTTVPIKEVVLYRAVLTTVPQREVALYKAVMATVPTTEIVLYRAVMPSNYLSETSNK